MSLAFTAPAILDAGHYATHDRRNPTRPRVQTYRVTSTANGLDVHAVYGRSCPRLVARWSADLGLRATGDNGHHYALVEEIFAAPTTAQALYGQSTRRCSGPDCNRLLTDGDSIAAGLGPECRRKQPRVA